MLTAGEAGELTKLGITASADHNIIEQIVARGVIPWAQLIAFLKQLLALVGNVPWNQLLPLILKTVTDFQAGAYAAVFQDILAILALLKPPAGLTIVWADLLAAFLQVFTDLTAGNFNALLADILAIIALLFPTPVPTPVLRGWR